MYTIGGMLKRLARWSDIRGRDRLHRKREFLPVHLNDAKNSIRPVVVLVQGKDKDEDDIAIIFSEKDNTWTVKKARSGIILPTAGLGQEPLSGSPSDFAGDEEAPLLISAGEVAHLLYDHDPKQCLHLFSSLLHNLDQYNTLFGGMNCGEMTIDDIPWINTLDELRSIMCAYLYAAEGLMQTVALIYAAHGGPRAIKRALYNQEERTRRIMQTGSYITFKCSTMLAHNLEEYEIFRTTA